MRTRSVGLPGRLAQTVITAVTIATLGCGGGGDDGGGFTAASGPVGGIGSPAPVVQPQTFNFPNFTNNSRLTVVSTFQTSGETPPETGSLTATLSDVTGAVVPRSLFRASPAGPDTNRCGFADCDALQHLMGGNVSGRVVGPQAQIRPRFQELAEGAEEDFYIVPAFKSVTAEKILQPGETQHCTIFAELVNGNPVISRARALSIAQAFDSNNPQRPGSGIYDQVREVFGSEWNQNPAGGNDGDEKIVLFFFSSSTAGSGLFGFTSPADSFPDGGGLSNKGEIVYINGDKDEYQQLATISHEFQHLVNQNQKVNQQGLNPAGAQSENTSLNEGLSGLAEEVCGYSLDSGNTLLADVVNNYLEKPERHEFFDFFEAGLGYGQTYLFFKYVREHFGDQTILNICTDSGTGRANLDKHLSLGFAEVFRRWTIANYASTLSGSVPSIYRYPSGFRTDGNFAAGALVGVNTLPMSNNQSNSTNDLKPWSVAYLVLDNEPGTGLSATILPASAVSPFGVIFEATADQFTSFQD